MKNKIYRYLLDNKIIIAKDVYEYGYSYLKQYLIYLIIVIPFTLYFNTLFATICFLCLYFPFRSSIGGYHFKNNIICLLFSTLITIICPLLSKVIIITFPYYLISSMLVFIITSVFVPVDHINKRLKVTEKTFYKRRAIIIELIYLILSFILYKYHRFITILSFNNMINIISVILGKHCNK